jgi:hypothetical protein
VFAALGAYSTSLVKLVDVLLERFCKNMSCYFCGVATATVPVAVGMKLVQLLM